MVLHCAVARYAQLSAVTSSRSGLQTQAGLLTRPFRGSYFHRQTFQNRRMQRDLCFTSGEGGDIPVSIHPDLKFSAKVTPNLRFLLLLLPTPQYNDDHDECWRGSKLYNCCLQRLSATHAPHPPCRYYLGVKIEDKTESPEEKYRFILLVMVD